MKHYQRCSLVGICERASTWFDWILNELFRRNKKKNTIVMWWKNKNSYEMFRDYPICSWRDYGGQDKWTNGEINVRLGLLMYEIKTPFMIYETSPRPISRNVKERKSQRTTRVGLYQKHDGNEQSSNWSIWKPVRTTVFILQQSRWFNRTALNHGGGEGK